MGSENGYVTSAASALAPTTYPTQDPDYPLGYALSSAGDVDGDLQLLGAGLRNLVLSRLP